LRRWLLVKGTRTGRQKHRQWRERKPCFGAMVQLDGSDHDWFEGRRARAVLMVMVDDATGRVWAQFFDQETTHASYDMLEGWAKRFGMPRSVYVACGKRFYQLDQQHEPLSLVGRKVVVRTLRSGKVQLVFRGTKLRWKELGGRPVGPPVRKSKPAMKRVNKPATEHPWRRSGIAAGRKFWGKEKARGQAVRQQLALVPSGRPSLRCGRPTGPKANCKDKQRTRKRGHSLVS
jgi:hypothetical protein